MLFKFQQPAIICILSDELYYVINFLIDYLKIGVKDNKISSFTVIFAHKILYFALMLLYTVVSMRNSEIYITFVHERMNIYTCFMTEKKRIVFIVNPISGTQNKESIINMFDDVIDKDKYVWEVRRTEKAGHAVELAAQAAEEGVDIVVAVGGDGTMNEVARSLVGTKTALAIIPMGSGNGLARHLQIPMDAKGALKVINDGLIERVDSGKINDTAFFCTCGVGFDAFVSLKFSEAGKRGVLTYLEKILQESLNYKPETYELETEEEKIKYKAFLIACGNASQYGNNAYITPQATVTDGLLDVTILEPFTALDIPSLAFQLFNKTIDHNSRIKTFKCKKIHIHRDSPGVVHFDGDPMMAGTDICVEVIQKGLYVVVPQGKKKGSSNVLLRASDYINGLKMLNESIVKNIARKNEIIRNKNKALIKKITGKKE